MGMLKNLNLGVAFLLELAMLVIYGYFGYRLLPAGTPAVFNIGLAILLPVVLAVFWGFRLAPKAVKRFKMPGLLIAKVMIFGAGTVMLWRLGNTSLAVVAAVVSAVHLGLSVIWKQM